MMPDSAMVRPRASVLIEPRASAPVGCLIDRVYHAEFGLKRAARGNGLVNGCLGLGPVIRVHERLQALERIDDQIAGDI
jgi:hypothetical protein